jgi:hypothetical protein
MEEFFEKLKQLNPKQAVTVGMLIEMLEATGVKGKKKADKELKD